MTPLRSNFLWMTDPWQTLDHPQDTTLRLMEEACLEGFSQAWCDVKTIRFEEGRVVMDVRPVLSITRATPAGSAPALLPGPLDPGSFRFAPAQVRAPEDFSQLHYRTDPPIDLAYLHPLQLLGLGLRGRTGHEVVNPLNVLFRHNEKFEAATLPDLMPPSFVSSQWERLLSFGKSEGVTVLKPLHQAQSLGIELLDWRTSSTRDEAKAKLERATSQFNTPVLLQRYLPGIADGEVRLWFLDGKLLAYAKKLPPTGDFRVNMDGGSRLALHTLSEKEKTSVGKISGSLRAHRIRLTAVDLIEGFVTDFNFTSPGLITQMEALLGENLAKPIIRALNPLATRDDLWD